MNANHVAAVVLAASSDRSTWGAGRYVTPICGVPTVERVRRALAAAGFPSAILVTGAAADIPNRAAWTSVVDLSEAARAVGARPVLVVSGDLALVTGGTLRAFWDAFSRGAARRVADASGSLVGFRTGGEARDLLNAPDAGGLPCPSDAAAWKPADADDVRRLLSSADVAPIAQVARRRVLDRLIAAGAQFVDPDRTYVDEDVEVGPGSIVYPGSHLVGTTRVGADCRIGPDAWVEASVVEERAQIRYSVVEESRIRSGSAIGPFAHVRPRCDVGPDVRIGNFVEVKASRLGRGVKAGHLAYLGDADIGDGTNIGAGAITCNFDGAAKHRTVVGADAFVGTNVSLVAPVTIGDGAFIAAGSTITEDVPAGALALARARQVIKDRKAKTSGEDT